MIPILLGVTLITFLLFNVVGRNPAEIYAGKNASQEQINLLEEQLGLNLPLHQQYFFFLKQVLTLDFGRSWSSKQSISTMLKDGVGASLSLTVPAFLLTLFLSLIIALFTAYKRGSFFDRSLMVISLAGMSISVLVYIIFFQYVMAFQWGLFPISGYDPSLTGRWQYLVLPWIISVVVGLGGSILFYRTVILEEIFQDYVRTARAKGLGYKKIYLRHILKNAMIPVITLVVLEMPALYTGSLLLEAFFGIPGLGGMMVFALQNSDFPVIKAMTVIGAILYMVFSLFADICYALVDPRVRLK